MLVFRLGGKNQIILVKFVSVAKRDLLMRSYWTNQKLILSQVCPSLDLSNRIYLNDNYSTMTSKMMRFAKQLKKNSEIESFSQRNGILKLIDKTKTVCKFSSYKELLVHFSSYDISNTHGVLVDDPPHAASAFL